MFWPVSLASTPWTRRSSIASSPPRPAARRMRARRGRSSRSGCRWHARPLRRAGGGRSCRRRSPSVRRCRRPRQPRRPRRRRGCGRRRPRHGRGRGRRQRRRRPRGSCRGAWRSAGIYTRAAKNASCWAAACAHSRSQPLAADGDAEDVAQHLGELVRARRRASCPPTGRSTDSVRARSVDDPVDARLLHHERLDEARLRVGRHPPVVRRRRPTAASSSSVMRKPLNELHSCWPIHHEPPGLALQRVGERPDRRRALAERQRVQVALAEPGVGQPALTVEVHEQRHVVDRPFAADHGLVVGDDEADRRAAAPPAPC